MPIFGTVLHEVRKHAEREKVREGKGREGELAYWLECPSCGKRVAKKELLSKGCYVCGWHEASDEAELAKIMRDSQVRNDAEQTATSYRTNCPRCNARLIRRELMEGGCYICGWKPQAQN